MRICKVCKEVHGDTEKFCRKCGTRLDDMEEGKTQNVEYSSARKTKSKRWIVELIVAIILVVSTAVLTLYVEHKILPEVIEKIFPDKSAEDEKESQERGEKEEDEVKNVKEINEEVEGTNKEAEEKIETEIVPDTTPLDEVQRFQGDQCFTELTDITYNNVGDEYTSGYYWGSTGEGIYLLNGEYKSLNMDLAINDDYINTNQIVKIKLYDENENLIGETDEMRDGQKPKEYSFSVEGVESLKVVCERAYNKISIEKDVISHKIELSK